MIMVAGKNHSRRAITEKHMDISNISSTNCLLSHEALSKPDDLRCGHHDEAPT